MAQLIPIHLIMIHTHDFWHTVILNLILDYYGRSMYIIIMQLNIKAKVRLIYQGYNMQSNYHLQLKI